MLQDGVLYSNIILIYIQHTAGRMEGCILHGQRHEHTTLPSMSCTKPASLTQQDLTFADTQMIVRRQSGLPKQLMAVAFVKWNGLLVGFGFPGLEGKPYAKEAACLATSGHSSELSCGQPFQPIYSELVTCRARMAAIKETPDMHTTTDLRASCMQACASGAR